jgi:uncharacterized protein YkwD
MDRQPPRPSPIRQPVGARLGSTLAVLAVTAGISLSSLPAEAAGTTTPCPSRTQARHGPGYVHSTVWHEPGFATPLTVIRPLAQISTAAPPPSPPPTSDAAAEIALVNQDRAAAGLPPLRESAELDKIATARATDMAVNNYFSHYRPGDPTLAVLELLRADGVSFTWYGENIIWESGLPPDQVLTYFNTWWMNSPEHRANILSTHYGQIGVGEAFAGDRVIMVEDFTN